MRGGVARRPHPAYPLAGALKAMSHPLVVRATVGPGGHTRALADKAQTRACMSLVALAALVCAATLARRLAGAPAVPAHPSHP